MKIKFFLVGLFLMSAVLFFSCEENPTKIDVYEDYRVGKTIEDRSIVGKGHNYLVEKTYEVLLNKYPEGFPKGEWTNFKIIKLVTDATNTVIKNDPSLGGILTYELDTLSFPLAWFNSFANPVLTGNIENALKNLNGSDEFYNYAFSMSNFNNLSSDRIISHLENFENIIEASNLSIEEKNALLMGISTGNSSTIYWKNNKIKWFKMIDPSYSSSRELSSGDVIGNDIEGAIGGAWGGSCLLPGAGSLG
ncbi:MAG: hypothetical protein CR982_05165 [Candidatus Cloacimonadota bacterium]|nr:MAG: hypothetical protein CR982_05165 [Candidatus Cloacimonadota bacterium]PIE78809.1 MAG: hypothetical protein CSA15_06050 [Candidatus Delongbacteria bacterium]